MSLIELKDLISRFDGRRDSTPISLNDNESRICGTQEIFDMNFGDVYLFIFFDEFDDSKAFDIISNESVSRKISKISMNSTINILTNNANKIKSLNFLSKSSAEVNKRIRVQAIPKKLAEEIINDTLDNDFILSSPSHVLFIGRYSGPEKARLSEVSSFLTLHDMDFFNALKNYFLSIVSRAEKGEFR
ncbi:hypothetical protein [Aeromonas sp. 5HA1]|uniref:hypothetical protein n=1 Tax=Aeromonas sp. 5HA1 TaxID=2699197 RepID=UPI0023DD706C|nr:hypothetical protein [Aeromonas sp. 5HA1]MDF2400430.1 hypothetical protein [Aeromonas sp. 5HA1]